MVIRFLPVLVATLLFAPPALALDTLSLQEAIAKVANHPRLRAAARQVDAARAREVQAGALPNPNLTLLVDQVPVPNPINGNFMAGVSQPLLLAGQREARLELARLETRLAEYDLEIERQALVAQVKEAYAQVLFELAGVAGAEAAASQASANLKALQAYYRAGEAARVDVLRAEVEAGRGTRTVATARNRAQQARAHLNVLLGRDAQAPLTLPELSPSRGSFPALPELTAMALEARVELQRAAAAIERETLTRRLAQAGQWTGTEVTGAVGAVAGQPGFSATLTVPMPFYRLQGEIAEAEANRARAEAERDALRSSITLAVEEAYRDRAIAAGEADQFARSYLPQAERLLKNAEQRFKAGEGAGAEVAEARRALLETRAGYQQALLAYRQAVSALERAVGGPLVNQ